MACSCYGMFTVMACSLLWWACWIRYQPVHQLWLCTKRHEQLASMLHLIMRVVSVSEFTFTEVYSVSVGVRIIVRSSYSKHDFNPGLLAQRSTTELSHYPCSGAQRSTTELSHYHCSGARRSTTELSHYPCSGAQCSTTELSHYPCSGAGALPLSYPTIPALGLSGLPLGYPFYISVSSLVNYHLAKGVKSRTVLPCVTIGWWTGLTVHT